MKTATYKLLPLVKILTVSLLLLAMLVSVGYTGQGKIVCKAVKPAQPEQVATDTNGLSSAPIAPDQSGGKMAPNKTTSSLPATFNASPVANRSISENPELLGELSYGSDRIIPVESESARGLPHSTSMISSELGRQFTLVGAKPSGTM